MSQSGPVARGPYGPGNLCGERWEPTSTRNPVWRHVYLVTKSCGKDCTMQVPHYNYMTVTDSRLDKAAITLKALLNSNTNIDLDFAAKSLASKNDLDEPYTSKDVT